MLNGISAAIFVCAFTLAEVCISFVVLLVLLLNMASGITNTGQHCNLISLVQCLSNNEILYTALRGHLHRHVEQVSIVIRFALFSSHF